MPWDIDREMNIAITYNPDGTLQLNRAVALPQVLDVLIVGGGPAGTAAAFRAKELGLSALVIDFDDLMKRIRDYAKDKLIMPDYGGGDKMPFPNGGELIALLHFAPMDKDDMCREWKNFYREHNVPAQIGVELTGWQRRADGVWQVRTYNHNTKAEQYFLAKHVVIAMGRGVPRRFDIPGRTEGIAYRLSDPDLYVDAPALVIGGGTSAAEAVIAVSHAKIKANDASAVYWSYRGDKLPKVSKALAESFFEAYMGNGNIRHYAYSEPVAIVTGADQKEYLSLRIDRREMANRPHETAQLEFAKDKCLACIGEDVPTAFLSTLGIEMGSGGAEGKKRFLVTPLLETQQPNTYLIGDLLSPIYYETEDFNAASSSSYKEIKRRGNIKAALRDGVLVIEAIAQKLAGKKHIRVDLDFAQAQPASKARALVTSATAIGAAQESLPQDRNEEESQAYLVRVLAGNVEGEEFPVRLNRVTTIGKNGCDLNFPDDALMSERHASIAHSAAESAYFLRDDGGASGVFMRLKESKPCEVAPGNMIRLGKQFLVFGIEAGRYYVEHCDAEGNVLKRYDLSEKTLVLGRMSPDITLDANDLLLSRRHLSMAMKDRRIIVKDLGSANGSFLKVRSAVALEANDQFRIGQQTFKFCLKEEPLRRAVEFNTEVREQATMIMPVNKAPAASPVVERKVAPPHSAKREEPKAANPEGMMIVFKNWGKSCPFKPGQTICDVAEKNGVKIKADCHIGSCGMDPIRIISGAENLNAMSDEEKGTLEDINRLKSGPYRLACMAKPKGPVTVEMVEG
jgi:thioredoxin reductase/ferredoxin/pSer/pThr/pTyr-binding forkhead associated (FHA) protein